MAPMYAVVLAGGGGTRLWPLSRPDRPKPFLPLLGEETLLQRTVRRLAPLIEPQDVYIVTDRRHLALVAEQLPEVPAANVLGEPVGRNTAAAVALAAALIDRPGDDVMAILPADHQIADEEGFRAALAVAAESAADGALVTLGIEPSGPETGYGYVLAEEGATRVGDRDTFAVERFVEKPDRGRAEELLASGRASWNAGIFVWRRDAISGALAGHAADIVEPLTTHAASADGSGGSAVDGLEAVYSSLRATSIDYAVLEPASVEGRVRVVPVDVGWSDLGSWSALRDAWFDRAAADGDGSGSVGRGERIDRGSVRTLVLAGDRPIVTIGLRDTIVIDTPDGLLVCAADRSQDVREAAEELARMRAAGAPRTGTEEAS